jgi:hypothetical protein
LVCPYCSTDMEPIELNGKTFCSNCGLTIGAATPHTPAADISPYSATDQSAPTSSFDTVAPVATLSPQTPIKDEMKESLGLPINEEGDLIIADSKEPETSEVLDDIPTIPTEPETPVSVKLSVNSTDEVSTSTDESYYPLPAEAVAAESDRDTEPDEPVAEMPPVSDFSDTIDSEIPHLTQSVDIPDENDFESAPAQDPDDYSKAIEKKIEEVDTLGASGILLDILNENYKATERSNQVKALEAAEDLVEQITVEPETHSESKPTQGGDILDSSPVNPLEHLEITSPLDELEIVAPVLLEKTRKTKTKEIDASEPLVAPTAEVTGTEETPEADELYMLPHELPSKPGPKKKKATDKAIKDIEKELENLSDPKTDTDDLESMEFDPDTIAPIKSDDTANTEIEPVTVVEDTVVPEVVSEEKAPTTITPEVEAADPTTEEEVVADKATTDAPEESPSLETLPIENTVEEKPHKDATLKQAAVTSFFKNKIEGPNHKKKGLFDFAEKKKKTQKTKTKLPLGLILSITIPTVILVVLIGVFSYLYFANPATDKAQNNQVAETTNFSSLTPLTIPVGFEMTSSNFDPATKTMTIKYAFANESEKTITYTQKEVSDVTTAITDFVKTKPGATFITKEESGTSFTELNSKDLVWTKDNFLFTIETVNYDFALDLIYKMALSIG